MSKHPRTHNKRRVQAGHLSTWEVIRTCTPATREGTPQDNAAPHNNISTKD
jgi:hypothetical protein